MTDPATQFTVPAAADAVAAVIGDRDPVDAWSADDRSRR